MFSRLLQHPARKRSGSILTTSEPAWSCASGWRSLSDCYWPPQPWKSCGLPDWYPHCSSQAKLSLYRCANSFVIRTIIVSFCSTSLFFPQITLSSARSTQRRTWLNHSILGIGWTWSDLWGISRSWGLVNLEWCLGSVNPGTRLFASLMSLSSNQQRSNSVKALMASVIYWWHISMPLPP